jgi:UDP-N-acetyl-D-galactosamine dehydrogenase
VPDIIAELQDYGIEVLAHDPMVDPDEAAHEYGIRPVDMTALRDLDGLVVAVAHRVYREMDMTALLAPLKKGGGVVVDVKGMVDAKQLPAHVSYWRL